MEKKFRIGDIQPNPFRAIDRYPLRPDKIDALRESIRTTKFWDNIVARIREDGLPEIAYGHHRLEALRQELGPDYKIGLIIRKIDDGTMLQMMIRDNLETYGSWASVEQESVRAVVEAYAAGKIELETPGGGKSQHRFAPSFYLGETTNSNRRSPYSATTLSKYLGWKGSKAENTILALELIEEEILTEAHYQDLKPTHALAMTRAIRRLVATLRRQAADYDQDAREARKEHDNAESEEMRIRAERRQTEALRRAKRLRSKAAKKAQYQAEIISSKLRDGSWTASQVSGKVKKRFNLDTPQVPAERKQRSQQITPEELERPPEVEFYLDSLDSFTTLVLEVPGAMKSFSLETLWLATRQQRRLREALLEVEQKFERRRLRTRAKGRGGLLEYLR